MVNVKKVVVFAVVLCAANETSEFSLGGGSSSSVLFLVENKYRTEISPKIAKIGYTKLIYVRFGWEFLIGNLIFFQILFEFSDVL